MEQPVNPGWRKSSHSSSNGGACIEVGGGRDVVLVRDTTQNGAGPVLRVSPSDFRRLVASVR
jgi:hypothetical protein